MTRPTMVTMANEVRGAGNLEVAPGEAVDVTPSPDPPAVEPLMTRRPWYRRILRRLAKSAAVVFVALTMLSLPYNAYTADRVAPPPGLSYVTADGIRTRYEQWGTTGT